MESHRNQTPQKVSRRLVLGIGIGAVIAIGSGVAIADSLYLRPGVEAYSGVAGIDPRGIAASEELDEQVEAAVEEFLDSPSAEATIQIDESTELINVILTYVDFAADLQTIEAAGYVPVVEDEGTCILRLTSTTEGDGTVEQQVAATPDVAGMMCADFSIPVAGLSSGVWQAVLGYESATTVGASLPLEVVVS